MTASRDVGAPPPVEDIDQGFDGRYRTDTGAGTSDEPSRRRGGGRRSGGGTTSRPHDVTTSTKVDRPVSYTLRMTHDESDELNGIARGARRVAHRVVDQSEALRVLIKLAADDSSPVAQALRAHFTHGPADS